MRAKSIFKSVPAYVLYAFLLCAIAFSLFQNSRGATPNPGHPWTEIGEGRFIVSTSLTGVRTFTFPDASGIVLTSTSTVYLNSTTKTGAYSISSTTDAVIYADGTSAAFTLTLPDATQATGAVFFIKKIDVALANLITIAPQGGQTIDGITSVSLAQRGEAIVIQSDGTTTWRTISRRDYDISGYRSKGSTLNQWYTAPVNGTALAFGTPTIGHLRAIPFIISKGTTIDQMAIIVTTAGTASNARVGIYADNGNNYPGTLVVDAGSSTTVSNTVKTFTTGLPVTLDPGLYWLVHTSDGSAAAAIRTLPVAAMNAVLGYASTLPVTAQLGWDATLTFGALPATYPAGAATIIAAPIPAVFVRTSQ